ncbi:UBA-like domain-containing protein 2-B [Ciona intestinalis]|uniref:UBA-like domain-containing protein 2-B n=1 Tax=Ciona intestinalis TaxID=7719 RepID=H2Y2D7_CIOIN|nr:UBA-like domain-containing protein 2-B [Ciona intestinalis]|eukprot:XP_002130954.1 UBA-like domain-containing protein 2-B [Ciona intestinalis]
MDDVNLKHEVMVNQFVLAAGCLSHEAREHLKSTHWHFEAALSRYFQESGIPQQHNQHPFCPPTNTPATPPAFPEALLAFSKMQTGEKQQQNPPTSNAQQTGSQQIGFMKVNTSS